MVIKTIENKWGSTNKNFIAKKHKQGYKKIQPYLYLAPILIFSFMFVYYPFLKNIIYSFSLVNFQGEVIEFVGLENYRYLLEYRNFKEAFRNTLFLTMLFVPLNFILSMSLALIANKKRKLSFIYEVLYMLPIAVSMSSSALIFKIILNPTTGFINNFFGLDIGWFMDKDYALYGILLVCIWMGFSFNYLLLLSALRGIPAEVIEASDLDGANTWVRFFKVQLPMIKPTVFYILCIQIVMCMMTSGPVMVITEGGPNRSTMTLIYLMYSAGYQSSNYSLAACVSIITFLLTFGFVALSFIAQRKGDES